MRIQDRNLDDVLKHVRARFDSDLPNFTDCIGKAFAGVDVVFWRERYLEFYWKCVTTVPGYIQQVVAANAEAESAGSKGLFDLWTQLQGFAEAEEGVERHFRDESRHARLFVRLTQLAFPDFKSDAELFDWKNGLFDAMTAPREKSEQSASLPVILDNLVQMNIGEIRTRAHMFMIGPVLAAFAPAEHREQVDGILSGLVFDEVSHIGYTAYLMEKWCEAGHKPLIEQLYARRLRDFDRYTIEQTRQSIDLYGGGEFPDLLEI